MTANWTHGPIYCSSITASLVLQQIRVDPQYVVRLPMHQIVNIEGINVTLIDANQSVLPMPLLTIVAPDRYYFYLKKIWASEHFEYCIVVTFEHPHTIFNILPFVESI
jgi:hypothetical protein